MSSTLLTAAIILGVVFIFILLFIFIHKKGLNKKLARQKVVLADVGWKNKLEINEQEHIHQYLLGIDKTNFVLLHIDFSEPKEEVTMIDLWQIKKVKVSTEENSIYEQRKGKSVLVDKQVTKLQLEVTLLDNNSKKLLPLLQYKDGMQDLAAVRKRADYWCHLINLSVQELPPSSTKDTKYA